MVTQITLSPEQIAEFCRRNHIRRLSLFGSVLRDDFRPDSDVDVLVEFDSGVRISLLDLSGMQIDLGEILGREVHLLTPGFLSDPFRQRVLETAQVYYERR